MALINCPKCGWKISDSTKRCPNCGHERKVRLRVPKPSSGSGPWVKYALWLAIVLALSLIGNMVLGILLNRKSAVEIKEEAKPAAEVKADTVPTAEIIKPVLAVEPDTAQPVLLPLVPGVVALGPAPQIQVVAPPEQDLPVMPELFCELNPGLGGVIKGANVIFGRLNDNGFKLVSENDAVSTRGYSYFMDSEGGIHFKREYARGKAGSETKVILKGANYNSSNGPKINEIEILFPTESAKKSFLEEARKSLYVKEGENYYRGNNGKQVPDKIESGDDDLFAPWVGSHMFVEGLRVIIVREMGA